ncbi:MAG: hypothetical protein ACT4TC_20245 [Myxococcaceae bacterium]
MTGINRSILPSVVELQAQGGKLRAKDLKALVDEAHAQNGEKVSDLNKLLIGDFVASRVRKGKATDNVVDEYEELVKKEGFPSLGALDASISGGA